MSIDSCYLNSAAASCNPGRSSHSAVILMELEAILLKYSVTIGGIGQGV